MADDIYQGMFIPKGSIVVPNVRCGRFYDTYTSADTFLQVYDIG